MRTATAKKFSKVSPAGEEWTLSISRFPTIPGEVVGRERFGYKRDGVRVEESKLSEAEIDWLEAWEEEIFLAYVKASRIRFVITGLRAGRPDLREIYGRQYDTHLPCVVLPASGWFWSELCENCENQYRWHLKERRKAVAQGLIRKGMKAGKKRGLARTTARR